MRPTRRLGDLAMLGSLRLSAAERTRSTPTLERADVIVRYTQWLAAWASALDCMSKASQGLIALDLQDRSGKELAQELMMAVERVLKIDHTLTTDLYHAYRDSGLRAQKQPRTGKRGESLRMRNLRLLQEGGATQERIFAEFERYLQKRSPAASFPTCNALAKKFSRTLGLGESTIRKYLAPVIRAGRKAARTEERPS
jgi:hypothetical protein